MTPEERRDALLKAADDRVRAAQQALGARLRILSQEAADVAVQLAMATPQERITSYLPARYAAVRHAIAHLEAEREGAAKMREEAVGLVQQRSA